MIQFFSLSIVVQFVDLCRFLLYLINKMLPDQDKAKCVSRFMETKYLIQVRCNFRSVYSRNPPSRSNILHWVNKFLMSVV